MLDCSHEAFAAKFYIRKVSIVVVADIVGVVV